MRNDLVDVTLVVDRSGSMQACKEEAENGVNHFVEEQKKQQGEAVFSLVQFDTEYEFVHKGVSINQVPKFTLVPRGMTALLDAIGRAINETGERLAKIVEEERPGLVVFVIVTDGQENSSHEFTKAQIKTMIEQQSKEYSWQFTFLGANQDAFSEAVSLGISLQATANFVQAKTQAAFSSASMNVSRMRTFAGKGQRVVNIYSDEEREKMEGKR